MNLATIDIGTNTTLLLVARTGPSVEVLADRRGDHAGSAAASARDVGARGRSTPRRSRARWRCCATTPRSRARHGARIAAVGTEALRRAPNAAAFLGPAAEILGTPVEVIDGEREAALTFRAVVASFPDLRPARWPSSTSAAARRRSCSPPAARSGFRRQPAARTPSG